MTISNPPWASGQDSPLTTSQMASVFQFFMTPREFVDFVATDVLARGLSVYLQDRARVRKGQLREVEGACFDRTFRVYLGEHDAPRRLTPMESFAPAEFGWIEVTPPYQDGSTLELAVLGSKWRWPDLITGEMRENRDAKRLFSSVKRQLQQRLKFGQVFITHVTKPGSRVVKDIGYSPGTLNWLRGGGELMQRGVMNTRFHVRPET